MHQDRGPAGVRERLLQGLVPVFAQGVAQGLAFFSAGVLLVERNVGNRQVVLAALEVAREALVEHDEFRPVGMRGGTRSGFLRPSRRNLPRKGGVAGKDQDGRAFSAHGRFPGKPLLPETTFWPRRQILLERWRRAR